MLVFHGQKNKAATSSLCSSDHGRPAFFGLPWSEEQRDEVAALFKDGKSIDELSEYFERSAGAIQSELAHQGLIE